MIMRMALLLLVLTALAMAQDRPVFTEPPVNPSEAVVSQISIFFQVLVPLMLLMVVLAAGVYVVGQIFGADIRAKATVWSHNMLAGVGVSAVIIILLYTFLPHFFAGEVGNIDLVKLISDIRQLAEQALVVIILLFLVLSALTYAMGQAFGAETRARATVWATGLLSGAMVAALLYILITQLIRPLESVLAGPELGLYAAVVIEIALAVAFIIVITYLAARVFKVPEWEAYLSIEMSNLVGSFLIVIFVIGLFGVGKIVAMELSDGAYSSPPQAAISYIQSNVSSSALKATIDVYKIQACTSVLSTFSKRIGEFVLTQTFKIFPGIDTFVQITNVLGFSLITLYSTASVQATMLYMADALMLPFFLPAGLILRFFPPTKDAGAFLISLAFGFYIVFPATYVINQQVYDSIFVPGPGDQPYYQSPTLLINSICGPFKFGVAGFLLNPTANPIFSSSLVGRTVGGLFSKLVSETFLTAISMAEFVPIMRHIASLSLLALFMPALSMMVTIAFINSMTKFIVYKV